MTHIKRGSQQSSIFSSGNSKCPTMISARLAFLLVLAVVGNAYAAEPEKVKGGRYVKLLEFPHQASLRLYGEHFCGGTIISKKHILTAAHCIDDVEISDLTVVTGTNNLHAGGEVHKVSTAVKHGAYIPDKSASWVHDIALITLTKPMEFNEAQKAIPLAKTRPPAGAVAAVSGFGYTEHKGQVSPILKTTPLNILSVDGCQKYYKIQHIFSSHLCGLLSVGHGACSGDSGGPLVYNNEVVGVVSWSIPCAVGMPDVFTSVADFYNWIVDQMH